MHVESRFRFGKDRKTETSYENMVIIQARENVFLDRELIVGVVMMEDSEYTL